MRITIWHDGSSEWGFEPAHGGFELAHGGSLWWVAQRVNGELGFRATRAGYTYSEALRACRDQLTKLSVPGGGTVYRELKRRLKALRLSAGMPRRRR